MTELTLEQANKIAQAGIAHARELGNAPMSIAVVDRAGTLRALQTEDGCALLRPDIALCPLLGAYS